jgi:hypothetical protein
MNSWSYVALLGFSGRLGVIHAASSENEDERTIRNMVDQAVTRLNRGDVTGVADFWDEDADYVGVDGKLTRGRTKIENLFRHIGKKRRQGTKRNNRTDSLHHTRTCDCGRLLDCHGNSGRRWKGVARD